jgi:hypothetical protein
LINLLGNAVKFSHQGLITLSLSSDAPDHYRFEIIDQGVGIASQQQQRIFAAFNQTEFGNKQGGSGLGLTIANKHISLMGGQLQLQSEQQQGSRFFFTLPLPTTAGAIKKRQKQPDQAIKPINYETIQISKEQYRLIIEAANDYEVAKLEVVIKQLSDTDEQWLDFAQHLKQYISVYDMDGLLLEFDKISPQ